MATVALHQTVVRFACHENRGPIVLSLGMLPSKVRRGASSWTPPPYSAPIWSVLRTGAETVVMVMTLLAHVCPPQAIVAAFGIDERTVADWLARAGRQGQAVHEVLVEHPRDLGQVQANEIRVKKQGGIVLMALAMMVRTRLWLAGEVSAHRDMTLIRRLIERVRRCAAPARSWSVSMA